jgi:hypothetical protein
MFSRLLTWLGWEAARPTHPARPRPTRAPRPRSATAHLFEKKTEERKPAKAENDFNPYNTGKFDRSASWERISKNQR